MEPRDAMALGATEERRRPLARAIDGQQRGVLERRGEVAARRVREVMRNEVTPWPPAPREAPAAGPDGEGLDAMVQQFEKQLILQALERHRWQREVTAEALGIHRKTLFTKMKKYALI